MPRFFIDFEGAVEDSEGTEFADVESARNAAIERLGAYIQQHPDFAYLRHWRVDVRDNARRLLLHVVICTVTAPPPINMASFEPSQS